MVVLTFVRILSLATSALVILVIVWQMTVMDVTVTITMIGIDVFNTV